MTDSHSHCAVRCGWHEAAKPTVKGSEPVCFLLPFYLPFSSTKQGTLLGNFIELPDIDLSPFLAVPVTRVR